MKTINISGLLAAALLSGVLPVRAQTAPTLDAVVERLERLERQNAELREQIEALRQAEGARRTAESAVPRDGVTASLLRVDALEEKLELQVGRLSEQDQVKAESSQRVPVRLTGMLLFNLFRNSRHGTPAGVDYPVAARVEAAPSGFGATIRRSILGLEFQAPQAVLGGKFRASLYTDLTIGDQLSNIQPRLRTVAIEGRWNRFAIFAGQDSPIFTVRVPSSFAQVQFGPLTGAGNYWLWRPQVRLEQTVGLGRGREFRARIGVSQTPETGGAIPPEARSSVEPRRPALEGHFNLAYQMDDGRGFEIGSGFHKSTTHVLQQSVPADLVTLDWVIRPIRFVEVTGVVFTGENMSKGGSTGSTQGFALVLIGPGVFQALPVGRRGGWTQVTLLPTARLTVNLQAGVEDPSDNYLLDSSVTKNTALIFNSFYRLAPNVVLGFELGQIRTVYKGGQDPRFNHHDLYLAFLF